MTKYIFWFIPFLISFATASGKLNDNFYVKLFAFELVFIAMLLLNVKNKQNTIPSVRLSDIFVLGLLMTYLFFYMGQANLIDKSPFIMYFLFYFFTRTCSNNKVIEILTIIAPIVITLHLLLCVSQYFQVLPNFNSYFTIGSTFGNPDMLSAYLAVLLPFCYMSNKWKAFRIVITGLTLSLFFLLQARTAIITSIIILLLYYIRKHKMSRIYILSGILTLIIGFIFLVNWHSISVLGRCYIWVVALSMVLSKPFGWGPYAFEKYYPEYQSIFTVQHPNIAKALNYDIVHSPYNEFLNITVTIGIIGLVLYLLLVAYVLITAYRTKSPLIYPLVSFQIVSLSYFPFKIIPLTVIYIICCSIVISTDKFYRIRITNILIKLKSSVFYIIVPVIICFLTGAFSFVNWKKGIEQSDKIETYYNACESFEKCYPFLKNNGRFLISFAELKYKMKNDSALTLMEEADKYFSDVAFLHNLAVLYEQSGRIADAKMKYKLAVNMSPNNADIGYAQILFLQRVGDIDEAYQLATLLRKRIINTPFKSDNKLILEKLNKFIASYES
ncbi:MULTISPECIES: O-antigen ligase family protein [Bacteroides]|uniref:O-antigen ligase family protein n=1 Tax=Bacteroides TaxID=816 RepID=UPI001C37872E|nr:MULTISPECIES: O-antigen ligase family protein [Bacteroides]MBV3636192.1 O-antigen ligase family protein [Bacteroides cellulosilyticus]MBV3662446.1 O-antigen ligase family protein [Bacteroides cellulosilyticus]MBV3684490.1 O-antigen ligase family protein [Bacteroides cellulosilyticus]MBV3693194.1 O-antigen ligase family protein [Bacteroides cellulosilyticus]MBV3706681.1 O-antigen ligase family protein [Bacteroides cellulosilyticus]